MAICKPNPKHRRECAHCRIVFYAFPSDNKLCCSKSCGEKYKHAIRLATLIDKLNPDGCWEWLGPLQHGYGRFGNKRVSRMVWEATHGPIPNGMFVCHKCDNPKCARIDHLFLGTPADNTHDMMAKGRWRNQHVIKTHCSRGHEFTPENTYSPPSLPGRRYCRICTKARNKVLNPKRRSFPPVTIDLGPRERKTVEQKRDQQLCKRSHPLSGENLIISISRYGAPMRGCRACKSIYKHNAYIRKKLGL